MQLLITALLNILLIYWTNLRFHTTEQQEANSEQFPDSEMQDIAVSEFFYNICYLKWNHFNPCLCSLSSKSLFKKGNIKTIFKTNSGKTPNNVQTWFAQIRMGFSDLQCAKGCVDNCSYHYDAPREDAKHF